MKQVQIGIAFLFWILLALDCVLIAYEAQPFVHVFTRGLLAPILLISLLTQTLRTKHKKSKALVITALVASCVSDVFLLNIEGGNGVAIGFVAFIIARLFYAFFFVRIAPFRVKSLNLVIIAGVFIIAFIAAFWSVVLQRVDYGKTPLAICAAVIGYLLLAGIHTYSNRRIRKMAWQFFIPGGVFFIFSDAVLALDYFYYKESTSAILIMATYATAQFLFVKGAVKFIKK